MKPSRVVREDEGRDVVGSALLAFLFACALFVVLRGIDPIVEAIRHFVWMRLQ